MEAHCTLVFNTFRAMNLPWGKRLKINGKKFMGETESSGCAEYSLPNEEYSAIHVKAGRQA
ncbi:hypothetical protein AOP6_0785 [Desulfuromonas sp. AOP6]|nr:hypothetical protein AOP6_0785 [Desulfuromonas sp. AOP6]